jgi:hypothetical protein
VTRVIVYLTTEECAALLELAAQERRNIRDQAALIIRRELEQIGLLPATCAQPTQASPAPVGMNVDHAR